MFHATDLRTGDDFDVLRGVHAVIVRDHDTVVLRQQCPAYRDGCW
jgi:hypothetical protein